MRYQTQTLTFPDDLQRAVSLIQSGECVAVKTETVYGLAGDAANETAIANIYQAKARPSANPLIVHIAHIDDMTQWASDIPEAAYRLAARFWPGPLSILLKKQPWVLDAVTGGSDNIVLRMPGSADFLSLIKASGTGLAAPSANKYKYISPTSAAHVLTSLNGRIAAVVDGGNAEVGIESTIVDVNLPVPTILRPGPITSASIADVLGCEVRHASTLESVVPGSAQQHYQPNTPVFLMTAEELGKKNWGSQEALISYSNASKSIRADQELHIKLDNEPGAYSKCLYDALHTLDGYSLSKIFIEALPEHQDWFALRNRIGRIVAR